MGFISAYGQGSVKKRESFLSELSGCSEERNSGGCHKVVLGEINVRVRKEKVLGVNG